MGLLDGLDRRIRQRVADGLNCGDTGRLPVPGKISASCRKDPDHGFRDVGADPVSWNQRTGYGHIMLCSLTNADEIGRPSRQFLK